MYIDQCKTGKYTRILLRESYRENGKVKHRTIANLSHCSPEEIEAIRLALKHKEDLAALSSIADDVQLEQGLSVGAVWALYSVAKQLSDWALLSSNEQERTLSIDIDQDRLTEIEIRDGCYVIQTDLSCTEADKETVHARYKDLSLVEQAFRTSKTAELEMRPIHVRLESRTRGHALVVMLAYRIAQELAQCWCTIDKTVQEAINDLTTLCVTEIKINGRAACSKVPRPRNDIAKLLKLAQIRLPEVIACKGTRVATRRKLPERRVKNCKKRT
jgi:hypothetical protein